jgi:hypothetical protein
MKNEKDWPPIHPGEQSLQDHFIPYTNQKQPCATQ